MKNTTITLESGRTMELIDITSIISRFLADNKSADGICYIFNPHTTAGLTINEGADPDVRHDIIAGLKEIVPMNYPFRHLEGNSPAHIMASLMGSSLTVIVNKGSLQLGTWQKIFFCEFDGPRTRKISCNFVAMSKHK
jgi:secondary thiamine-phosphate synthase enzyme